MTAGETLEGLLWLAVLAGIAWVLLGRPLRGLWRRRGRGAAFRAGRGAAERARASARSLRQRLAWPDPDGLVGDPEFEAAARELADRSVHVDDVVTLARDDNAYVACLALAALAARDDVPPEWTEEAGRRLHGAGYAERYFLLHALAARPPRPVVGTILTQLDEDVPQGWIARLVEQRLRDGEQVSEETFRRNVPIRLAPLVGELVDRERHRLTPEFVEAYEAWRGSLVDMDLLRSLGRVWERPYDRPPAVLAGPREEVVETIVDALASTPPRSLLLVGEHGVGKTALARAAADRLDARVVVFEATAAGINAGAIYVGELEGRVRELVEKLRGHPAIWVFPGLEEALYAGQHLHSPQGLLDALLPHVESGELTVVGEVTPSAYERLVKERPRVASAFEAVRVRALGEEETVAVARRALEHVAPELSAEDEALRETFELAQQFLPGAAPPGNVLRLLHAAAEEAVEAGRRTLDSGDVLATLARATGLPLAMLDADAPLDVEGVRRFFSERVMGQPEAVDTLVERITMIKAGLTDPARPLGVFLFVGPTGTGKTEIAKALAEFLFGSPGRLVRLDMSEFQTPDSLERLLADATQDAQAAPLIAAVRRDPFAVVLLDEFEKAAAPIWDVFLQVFDDGRLTDRQGRTADFRRCVIVLTSNVGSAIARGTGLGFHREREPFRRETVERAVERSFRPELLNRLDRIVVFRPLERSQMRTLLEKELAEVLRRRGLRTRPWAVELDEAALEFLIDRGFSPELGARPLKRALEQHLLAPLARAIVEQDVPEGEQFLFVRALDGRALDVVFVDPDADETATGPAPATARAGDGRLDARALALAPRAGAGESRSLLDALARIASTVRDGPIAERKRAALAELGRPGFWDDDARFAVLAEAEYLDRLEAAARTAEKLGERLRRSAERDAGRAAEELVELVASRVYVLEEALAGLEEGAPLDVFMRVRPAARHGDAGATAEFAARLAAMYVEWGTRRGMRVEALARDEASGEHVLAVCGLGAARILEREHGLHVLELVESGRDEDEVVRVTAAVQVAPWPPGPPAGDRELLESARRALDGAGTGAMVVRRYRPEPSPLVRDAVRGYRTGRLDRVLAGDFDLF